MWLAKEGFLAGLYRSSFVALLEGREQNVHFVRGNAKWSG
jgi:hypothetical protein